MSCKADLTVKPEVTPFFDPATNTISYVVKDPGSDACAVVDLPSPAPLLEINNVLGTP